MRFKLPFDDCTKKFFTFIAITQHIGKGFAAITFFVLLAGCMQQGFKGVPPAATSKLTSNFVQRR